MRSRISDHFVTKNALLLLLFRGTRKSSEIEIHTTNGKNSESGQRSSEHGQGVP